jgi:hypothetical protein
MGRMTWSQASINALTPAQQHSLVKAGILTIENTQAEEELWQVCMVMLDRGYIAELLGYHITTFNTYMTDEYRLVRMKEKLFTILGNDIRQRDIAIVHNMYKQLHKIVDAKHNEKLSQQFIEAQDNAS